MSPRASLSASRSNGSSLVRERPRAPRALASRAARRLVLGATSAIVLAASTASAGPAAITQARGSFPGGPHFVLSCGFSHRNNDDAIVFPGHPGHSHNHTYIGNFSVDSGTTPTSLLGGRTSCEFEADSSAYWAPTLYAGRRAVIPIAGFVYYVKRTSTDVAPHPAGLKMIAGNAAARRPQRKEIAAWSCGELGGRPRFAVIPSCARNYLVQVQITFPNCWNGTTSDSPDHRRHMAYASAGRCPVSHPVALPTVVLILLYPELSGRAEVASGRFGIHADFMNGWDQATLGELVAELNQQRD
jgi:Domain of unknown function (DUF1996)